MTIPPLNADDASAVSQPERKGRKARLRGKNLHGQYYEANAGHAVELDKPLDAGLAKQWLALARELGLKTDGLPAADGKAARGDFLRAAAMLQR